MVRDHLRYPAIDLLPLQRPYFFHGPSQEDGPVRVRRVDVLQITLKDLQGAEGAQPAHALRHDGGLLVVAAEFRQGLEAPAMGTDRMDIGSPAIARLQTSQQSKHRPPVVGGGLR